MAPNNWCLIMTCQDFLCEFIRTEKTFLEYEQKELLVRVIKIPVAENVSALFAHLTLGHLDTRYRFNAYANFEPVGYVDAQGNIRFPEYNLLYRMLDDGDKLLAEGEKQKIHDAIYEEVLKLAMLCPLPECMDKNNLYREAVNAVFVGQKKPATQQYCDFSNYITSDTIIDYLSNTSEWAKNIALAWGSEVGCNFSNGPKTKLDLFRDGLSRIEQIYETAQKIQEDPTHKIHRYIAMKNAVRNAKNVEVYFKTANHNIAAVKVPASAFDCMYEGTYNQIPLYAIIPDREGQRVAALLPKQHTVDGHEFDASTLPKDRIVAIKYRNKIIWQIET